MLEELLLRGVLAHAWPVILRVKCAFPLLVDHLFAYLTPSNVAGVILDGRLGIEKSFSLCFAAGSMGNIVSIQVPLSLDILLWSRQPLPQNVISVTHLRLFWIEVVLIGRLSFHITLVVFAEDGTLRLEELKVGPKFVWNLITLSSLWADWCKVSLLITVARRRLFHLAEDRISDVGEKLSL